MHHPTESLRQKHDEALLAATRELFGLDFEEITADKMNRK